MSNAPDAPEPVLRILDALRRSYVARCARSDISEHDAYVALLAVERVGGFKTFTEWFNKAYLKALTETSHG